MDLGAGNSKVKLTTWKMAQERIGSILDSLNASPSLMLAAASNPLFALQELGYEIPDDVIQEFEDRIRLGASGFKRIQHLRQEIFKIAGASFDLNSKEALHGVLSSVLGNTVGHQGRILKLADAAPLSASEFSTTVQDPLEAIRDLHPILEPLLEYRRLDASTPRFAPREFYDEIRQGKRTVPIGRLVARLHE